MNTVGNPNCRGAIKVTVEYDGKNGRETRTFTGAKAGYQARSFYSKQFKAGANPKVVSAAT